MAGLFDIFNNNNAQDAANAQIAGINAGQTAATGAINQGSNALTTNYTAALQPFLSNLSTANAGTKALTDALGITGDPSQVTARLQQTPGYQFQLQQGTENVLRNQSRTGNLASGATDIALQNQGQGQAQSTYQQYVQNLMPFLNQSNTAAAGVGNIYTGLGQGLNQNFNSLGQLDFSAATGKGNAQANADLANNQASANMWNVGLNAAKLATSFLADGGPADEGKPYIVGERGPELFVPKKRDDTASFSELVGQLANRVAHGPSIFTKPITGHRSFDDRAGYAFSPRADGGPTDEGRPYIVGERGPELFVPDQNGTVVPNEVADRFAAFTRDPRATGELRSRDPSWRERLASAILGDSAAPGVRDVMEGLIGSRGGPRTSNPSKFGLSLADLTPAGGVLSGQESYQEGDYPQATADAISSVMPFLGKFGRMAAAGLGAGAAGYFGSTATSDAATRLTPDEKRALEVQRQQEQIKADAAARQQQQQLETQKASTEQQIEAERARAEAATKAEIANKKAQAEFEREEKLRESQLPFRQKYPGLAAALPFIGTAIAGAAPFLVRMGGRSMENATVRAWNKAADEAEEALAAGDRKLFKAKAAELQAHSEEWAARGGGGRTSTATWLTSAALPTEAALLPSEYDVAMLPPGDPNREAAFNTLTNPIELFRRALPGTMQGLPAATLGSKLPLPRETLPAPTARTTGILSQLPKPRAKSPAKPKPKPKKDEAA